MKNTRIYQAGYYTAGQEWELSPEASQHIAVVLRMRLGEIITLFPGNGEEYEARIIAIQKKKVVVNILSQQIINRESPRIIHLAQAISKGERMELVIQKAVELGVTSITPLITERCVVRLDEARFAKKQAQWQAIAISAAEQSGRNVIPTVNPVTPFKSYLNTCETACRLVLSPGASMTFKKCHLSAGDIALLIGPEGGLSSDEIEEASDAQFMAIRLGPRVLRTETAAITALSVLQALYGDL